MFENVLSDYPDANFLDVILFNYGRCLYKLKRKPDYRLYATAFLSHVDMELNATARWMNTPQEPPSIHGVLVLLAIGLVAFLFSKRPEEKRDQAALI